MTASTTAQQAGEQPSNLLSLLKEAQAVIRREANDSGTSAYLLARIDAALSAPHAPQSEPAEERLIWIERNLFDHRWNGVIGSGYAVHWSIRGDHRHTTQKMVGNSFADALDAARASAGSSRGNHDR